MKHNKLKYEELETDQTIQDWFENIKSSGNIKVSKNTKRSYLTGLSQYIEWLGMKYPDMVGITPERLKQLAKADLAAGVLPGNQSVKKYITGFQAYLSRGVDDDDDDEETDEKKIAPHTIKTRITAVTSFYTAFDIPIPESVRKLCSNVQPQLCNMKIPTKDDIRQALKFCDIMEKAIILVGTSSGLAANEISNLTVVKFKDGYGPKMEITTLQLRRGKTNYDFITFLTPKASRAVWDYLKYRNRMPDVDERHKCRQKNTLDKQRVTSDNGYLFIRRRISKKYLDTHNEKLRRLRQPGILAMYRQLAEDSGESCVYGMWHLLRSHNMRKYFYSAMLNAGAKLSDVDYMVGHKVSSYHQVYYRSNPLELREKYAECIPALTIQKELDISVSDEYKKLQEENKIMRIETERHIVERQELQDLRKELEAQKVVNTQIKRALEKMTEKVELSNWLTKTNTEAKQIAEEEKKIRQAHEEWNAFRSEEDRMFEAASKHAMVLFFLTLSQAL